MSKFLSDKYSALSPYTPGEQPQDMKYIKLNTNESPFEVGRRVMEKAYDAAERIHLYPDPECACLRDALAELYGVERQNVIVTNGSDEALNFIFMCYGGAEHPFVFPDITYGFYSVFANLNGVPYSVIPLKNNFEIDVLDYTGINKNIVFANPNAPTGILMPLESVRKIAESNKDNIVVVDEAYIDFGGESSIVLTKEYKNLIVTGTFSKSRSMAGARVGFAIADEEIINDMNMIRYSTNPYNINGFSLMCALEVIKNNDYYMNNCKEIVIIRDKVRKELMEIGFKVTDSKANFLFAKHKNIGGKELYQKLKDRGILVRHFDGERIRDYIRITIGNAKQMKAFTECVKIITEEVEKNETV